MALTTNGWALPRTRRASRAKSSNLVTASRSSLSVAPGSEYAALPFVARRAPRCVVAAYLLWLAWLFIEESLVASLRNRPHPLDMLVIVVVPILTLTC